MKLITAIVRDEDAGKLTNALVAQGFRSTRVQSAGGFLRARNSTILIGVEDHKLEDALQVIRATCKTRTRVMAPLLHGGEMGELFVPHPIDVEVGGATIFVTPIEYFERV
jgi:uncharacterized protein YaaQ